MNGISRDTFEQMNEQSKLNVLFDYITESAQDFKVLKDTCLALKDRIDSRRKFDTTTAGVTGFMGGIIAHLGQLIFWKH